MGMSTSSGTRTGGRFGGRESRHQSHRKVPQESPRGTKGDLNKFVRRDRDHHHDDRKGRGHRADEERRALDEILEAPAFLNAERMQLDKLRRMSCDEEIGESDSIGFGEMME